MKSVEKHNNTLVPSEIIENRILLIRRQKVMIDADLSALYGVSTRHLKRQVRRNITRFPEDFMFRLTKEEKAELVPKWHRFDTLKHSSSLPMAFTEHGILMLSSVLNSKVAIQVNIQIMRVFTKLRILLTSHKDLKIKIEEMESKYDHQFKVVFDAIKELIELNRQTRLPEEPKKKFGFETGI